MLPRPVVATPTVAGVPVPVLGGCGDAVDAPPLPHAASASTVSATIAPPREVWAGLRVVIGPCWSGDGRAKAPCCVGAVAGVPRSADRRRVASVSPALLP